MNFETIIGIEIHMELLTNSKMFSNSKVSFNEEPNSCTGKVDLGLPGALPVVNKGAVEKSLLAALLLNCEINKTQHFDRKNYFYSDNPKGYQITQQETPMGYDGYVYVHVNGEKKKIRINRIHIEEDTAKQTHSDGVTKIDYNRAGNPLIEIVTEADIRGAEEAVEYVKTLRMLMMEHGISNAKMEEGSMRCDINISIRPLGTSQYGNKVEIKNLNSLSNIEKSIANELVEQKQKYLASQPVKQVTKRFDEETKTNKVMRSKETLDDYRYYWEPDIPNIYVTEENITFEKTKINERPWEFYENMRDNFDLNDEQIAFLQNNGTIKQEFLAALNLTKEIMATYNFYASTLKPLINEDEGIIKVINYEVVAFLMNEVNSGSISNKVCKDVVNVIIKDGGTPQEIIEANDWKQISDEVVITKIIVEILANNEQSVIDYKNGKDKAFGFLNGQAMKAFKGKGNPKMISEIMLKKLEG